MSILIRSKISPLNAVKLIARAVWGLVLTLLCTRHFPLKAISGKRVVVVGPASSALNTGQGGFIDSFDFVVRVNKAPLLLVDGRHAADIGTRTDILFHSFFENELSGGGPLDFGLFEQLGISYVVQPIPTAARVTGTGTKPFRSAPDDLPDDLLGQVRQRIVDRIAHVAVTDPNPFRAGHKLEGGP